MPTYPNFSFDIQYKDPKSRARIGRLRTPHGEIETPNYIFCGTKAAIKGLGPAQMVEAKTDIILANTYHLMLQPGADLIEKAGSDFLVYEHDGEIIGCVNLQQLDGRIYLGMLSVAPHLQARGTGKALLKAAEEYTIARGINKIYMSVISDRDELIDFYCRRGYRDTGERKFFEEDGRSGPHLKPLYFSYLEKAL